MSFKGQTDRDGRVKHREKQPMDCKCRKSIFVCVNSIGKMKRTKCNWIETAENDAHGRTECRRSARTRTRDCGSMRYQNTRWRTSRKRCSGTEEARTKDSLSRRVNRERVRFEISIFFQPRSVFGFERNARGERGVGTVRWVGDA